MLHTVYIRLVRESTLSLRFSILFARRVLAPLQKPWQEYYDPHTAALVLEMYRRDFELFGYPTAVPPPPAVAVDGSPRKSSCAAVSPTHAPSEKSALLHQPASSWIKTRFTV